MEEVEDRVVPRTMDKVAWVLIRFHTHREVDDEESLHGEVRSQDVPAWVAK
jgi:hypothetical protein